MVVELKTNLQLCGILKRKTQIWCQSSRTYLVWKGLQSMGQCVSTQCKSKRRHHHLKSYSKKRRGGSRGSAHFVIPVSRSSLGSAAQKYQIGKNAEREIARGGIGNALLIERNIFPIATTNGINSGHSQLEQHPTNNLQNLISESPSSRGSQSDTFFDIDENFHCDSDDDFMSSFGDFPTLTGNSLSYPANNVEPQRPTLAILQVGMSKVGDWMAGTSKEVDFLHSPPPEDEPKSTPSCGMRNGIAALAGNVEDNLTSEDNPLFEVSPRKSFAKPTAHEKVLSTRLKWERAVSDLLGRRAILDVATPHNLTNVVSPLIGESAKSSDYKGVFDGLCLPRLRSVVSSSRSRPMSPLSFKRKGDKTRFSFRRQSSIDNRDDHTFSSKYYVDRPMAGSQVSQCSADKPIDGCWSEVSSTNFKLRGKHYGKDKRKFTASNFSAFVPIGVDLLMLDQKIDHVAQYVELPFQDLTNEFMDSLPAIFIVNIQLPLYPPAIFMGDTDGEGLSLVLYFKLSDDFAKMAPPYFKDIFRKFVNDETEKVKGFVGESIFSFRDRLKVVARCVNPEEVPLNSAEKKLLVNYNEKPVLSRPQHGFHKGANYLEVDLDVHRFSYIARKGFDTFRDRLKNCVIDVGLTLQGTRLEELPEQILAAVRLHKLDFGDYRVLQMASSGPSVKSEDLNETPTSL